MYNVVQAIKKKVDHSTEIENISVNSEPELSIFLLFFGGEGGCFGLHNNIRNKFY